MSILSAVTGYVGFRVIDDAANAEVKNVTWVDDVNLEYEVLLPPASIYALGPYSDVIKVSAVSVNHAAREIHVNTPQPVMLSITLGKTPREASACDECCEENSCKRIGQCLRFKCAFGEVAKP
jgi:hypothetical protein